MTRTTPTIYDTTLLLDEAEQTTALVVGSAEWFTWLSQDTSTLFSFYTPDGSYTARKERAGSRRGGWYWKAYRTHQGRLYRAYLGKQEDLTLARLHEIAHTLEMRVHEAEHHFPAQTKPFSTTHMPGAAHRTLAPLLEIKLHPPRLAPGLVARTRLLGRLEACLEHKISLLLAPAGSGKSTLVSQWLATRGASFSLPSTAWVSLDASDNDPLRFWRSVMTVCQRLLAQPQQAEGQAALDLLTTPITAPFDAPPLDMALTRLLNALAVPASPGLLVLDDYHAINETLLHRTLAFFIDHLPAHIHVLLLSRAEPDLPLLRWRARGELFELHTAELRFSPDETATFLRQELPISISEAALNRLDSSLEGWAAGLRLLALTLATWRTSAAVEEALLALGEHVDLSSQQADSASAPRRELLAYFVTEILDTQPEATQHFLLSTSMLSRLCAPLCDAVTASGDSAAQLEAIARAGLFLEALEGPGAWYRYHTLFAEAMRREASRRLGEATLLELSLRASSWYEQKNLLVEAIEAAWLGRDLARVARLIELIHKQNFAEPQTMLRWLELLPEPLLRAHPLLCFLFATELRFPVKLWFAQEAELATEAAALPADTRSRVETLLHMAEEGWLNEGEFTWPGGIWAHRALSALIDDEPFSIVINFARQALPFLTRQEMLEPRLRMYRSACLLFVGREKLGLGQVGEASQLLLQAQADNVAPGNKFLGVDIHLMVGKVYLTQGELKLAQRSLRLALSSARELGDEKVITDALLELAWLAFEWNDLQAAEEQAREALTWANRVQPRFPELQHRARLQLILLLSAQGMALPESNEGLAGMDEMLEHLARLQAHAETAQIPASPWLLARAYAFKLAADHEQTILADLPGQSLSSKHAASPAQLLQGHLWLAQGQVQQARELFTRLLPIAQESLQQYLVLELHVLLTLAYALSKQEQQAYYWLRQTLLQTVHEGFIRLFLDAGKPMLSLLKSMLPSLQHDTTLRSYVLTILRAAQAQAPLHSAEQAENAGLVEPLSLQEERVLRLLIAGRNNQEIARELIISVNTVKYHIKHLYQKLGVSNRLQASAAARQIRLLSPDHAQS